MTIRDFGSAVLLSVALLALGTPPLASAEPLVDEEAVIVAAAEDAASEGEEIAPAEGIEAEGAPEEVVVAEDGDAGVVSEEALGAAGDDQGGDSSYRNDPSSLTYDVTDFGADFTGTYDSSGAINAALAMANGTDPITVVIPAGVYRLDSNLFIYSNTTLTADPEAFLITYHEGSMIKGSHRNEDGSRCRKEDTDYIDNDGYTCDHGGGYDLVHDVTITGGTWNANYDEDKNTQCILFRHANHITLSDLTVENATNHAVNISGSKDVLVEGVTFRDAVVYRGQDPKDSFWRNYQVGDPERYRFIEALHFDFCSDEAEHAGYPRDNTPCKDVIVRSCAFENVFAGIGTHHTNSIAASSIVIDSCTFDHLNSMNTEVAYGCPVYFKSAGGLTISNCTVTNGCRSLAELTAVADLSITGNSVNEGEGMVTAGNGVCVINCSGNIINNRFNTAGTEGMTNGIAVLDDADLGGSDIVVAGNSVCGCSEQGINVRGSKATLRQNTITQTKKSGIRVDGASTVTLDEGNTISSTCLGSGTETYYGLAIAGASTVTGTAPTMTGISGGGIQVNGSKAVLIGGSLDQPAGNGVTINKALEGSRIDGLTVTSPAGNQGIYLTSCDKLVTIKNVTVTDAAKFGILASNSKLSLTDSYVSGSVDTNIHVASGLSGSVVSGNAVSDAGKCGIVVLDSASTKVADNLVNQSASDGIRVFSSPATVTGNSVSGSQERGINVRQSKVTVSNNTVSGTTDTGIHVKDGPSGATVSNNTVNGSGVCGIVLQGCANTTVKDNTVDTCPKDGIRTIDSTAAITGNTLLKCGDRGINLQGSTVTAKSNTITKPVKFGVYATDSKVTLTSNKVTASGDSGIHVNAGRSGSEIGSNTVTNAGVCGIAVIDCPSIRVASNTLTQSSNDGIRALRSNATIEGNTTKSTSTTASSRDIKVMDSPTSTTIKNNTYGTRGFYTKATKDSKVLSGNTSPYVTVSGVKDKRYTGKAITQSPTIKLVDKAHSVDLTLKEGRDYKLGYQNNQAVGTATMKVSNYGPYAGAYYPVVTKASFKITKAPATSIAKAKLTVASPQYYTGKALKPAPKVTLGGKTLRPGTDYTVSYANNVKVGTATVTVTGKGSYSGSVKTTFKIVDRWQRLAGSNAVATMQAIVRADGVFTEKSVSTVVVAGRRDFKAALAGTGLAGLYQAPLMITDPNSATLSGPVKTELQRLKPSRVIVVGDTSVVPASHYNAIKQAVPKAAVSRVAGATPSATAVSIHTAGKSAKTKWGKTCVVATQAAFKDALSIAPYAYCKHAPIFFTESARIGDGKGLSAATVSAIKAGSFTRVLIVGGELAVPKSVEGQLKGITCKRLAGANAIETSRLIGQFELSEGMNRKHLAVATTQDFADALAGAALAGAQGSVLVLANQTGGYGAFNALCSSSELVHGHILGGPFALSEASEAYFRKK